MKKLLLLAGLCLVLVTTVANQAQAGVHSGNCLAPIIVSN
jgi:hypothetical protein